ncbi:ABC1 kinase family protein [Nocardia sp. CDC160]|uniref:ABC1 kinase family protein n=1 Tax=Nocardia sp. CDC160 TaxID=3112166 RepID=UPI002DB9759E|nr:AarF/ABC1/UbiB kinase family protein [Nocardia sp. CDC160]MEC3918355.1 AarF/ABC1/UbiB kinase family protein [Nocardia sp. CDC160]
MTDSGSGEAVARVIPFPATARPVPTSRLVRDTKLAGIPVAYMGRRMAGRGRRMLGRPAAEVERDIQLRTAQHLFEVLGELRGCAAKVGQMAGVYRAVLPLDLAGEGFAELAGDALSRLQDSVPPMLPALVHQVLAANLGPGWRTRFREFDDRPAAAASLGQVHRAVWHDGRAVAVKVMYPGARAAVEADLRMLRGMSGIIGALMPGADVRAVVSMVCAIVGDELDYHREGKHQQIMADTFADDPEFLVPNVIEHADEVLISEWVDGTPLSAVIASGSPEQRSRAGLAILRFIESSRVRSGLHYSDVHPGNFLILPDGRLGIVDFGACAAPPPHLERTVAELGEALYNGTPAELESALRAHGFVRPGQDFDVDEFIRLARPFLEILLREDFRLTQEWVREQSRALLRIRLSNVFRQMTLPPELTAVARSATTTMGVLCQLGTHGPIRDEFLSWWPGLAAVIRRYEST